MTGQPLRSLRRVHPRLRVRSLSFAPCLALLAIAVAAPARALPPGVDGMGAPTATIPRIEADVEIDGVLDEAPWSQATRLTGFSQFQPVDGRPAEEQTEVRVWYSPSAIYFGVIAQDRDPASIRATVADRDNIDADDQVVLWLDTFNDRRRAYYFAVNPLGVQQDGMRSEGASSAGSIFGGSVDRNPDYLFDSKGQITGDGYVVELRIPFKSLRYRGSGPQTWGLNVSRLVQRTGYEDTWTDVRRANASFLLQSGAIDGLHDLARGVTFEAQPFVTGTANGARDAATGSFERGRLDTSAGVNVSLGLTSLSIDLTVNPDFSQVETDEGQVTVNERFALFYPEKRPFFLEAIDLFATPNQLVYTRQIADPIAGGKLTGKLGRLGVAHLTAVDQSVDGSSKDALFNISRLRCDFGSNSVAGVTYTDRSVLGTSLFNRVAAGDARVVFGKLYYAQGQLGGSWTRDDAGARAAPLWRVEVDRTGGSFGFNYQLNGVGEDFVSKAGYVPRSDVVSGHLFDRFTFYGPRGALLESFSVFVTPVRVWRYGGFLRENAVEGSENLEGSLRLRGGWEGDATISRQFVHFDRAAYAGYETAAAGGPLPYTPLDETSGPQITLAASTPTYRGLDARVSASRARVGIFPEGSQGTGTNVNGGVALRPGESIRISASATASWLARRRDGTQFARTVIPRIKLEVQPSRALFFRLIGEYRSERQAALADARTGEPLLVDGTVAGAEASDGLRVDGLISFEPSPGTVAFLGYGSLLEAAGAFDVASLRPVQDGFFVKLAYHARR